MTKIGLGENDAFVLVADSKTKSQTALEAVIRRAKEAMVGVPEETRGPLPNGNTEYMRPLPGRARMYPETDVPSVPITAGHMARLRQDMPELLSEKKQRFARQYGLNEEMAQTLAYSPENETFEELAKISGNPMLVARTMLGTLTELRRDGVPVDNITDAHLNDVFRLVREGKIAKEAIPSVLKETAQLPEKGVDEAIRRLGLGGVGEDEDEVRKIIGDIVREKHDYVKEKGEAAQSGLMGMAMSKLRGKADGKLISRILKEQIAEELKK
jgi:glutamyl-tRNA(Gln) amidotransferase subunit E